MKYWREEILYVSQLSLEDEFVHRMIMQVAQTIKVNSIKFSTRWRMPYFGIVFVIQSEWYQFGIVFVIPSECFRFAMVFVTILLELFLSSSPQSAHIHLYYIC